jgi:hypothetical protein
MVIPISQTPNEVIASYPYTDLADGAGEILFYGGNTIDSVGTKRILRKTVWNAYTKAPPNGTNYSMADLTDTTFTKLIDIDFDAPSFNLPQVLQGSMLCSVPFAQYQGAGGGLVEGYVIVKLRKWNGSAETEVANAQSGTWSSDQAGNYHSFCVAIPTTHFKRGEILRITVEGWGRATAAATNIIIGIVYDVLGAAITETHISWLAGKSIMTFRVPFKVNY